MEILFDEMTAKDVAERLRVRAEIDANLKAVDAYLNGIALTVARLNGAKPDDRVSLNRAGTGVVLTPSSPPMLPEDGGQPSEPDAAAAPQKRRQ